MPLMAAISGVGAPFALSHRIDHSLPLSKLPLLQRMASNDNDKRKMEEVESSMVRKSLRHTDDDGSDDDSSNSSEEEPPEEDEEMVEEEVSSEETSMNQLNTSEEKLYARHARGILFKDAGDTTLTSSEPPPTPESRWRFDVESSDDDDFWL
jgi:hypothetical protein